MADFSELPGYEPGDVHNGDTGDESDMDYTFEDLEDGVHISPRFRYRSWLI